MTIEKRYTQSVLTTKTLSDEIDTFWAELKDPDSDARQIIEEEGIEVDPEQLAELKREDVITVKPPGMGVTGIELVVVLAPIVAPLVKAGANVAERVILDLWDVAFKRWIKRRKGGDALIERE
jgi:hypothetical protein